MRRVVKVVAASPRFATVHMLDIPTLLSSDDHKLMIVVDSMVYADILCLVEKSDVVCVWCLSNETIMH